MFQHAAPLHHHQPIQTVDVYSPRLEGDVKLEYEDQDVAGAPASSALSYPAHAAPLPMGLATNSNGYVGQENRFRDSSYYYNSQQEEQDDGEEEEEDDSQLAHLSKEELRKHKNRQSAARSRQRMRNRLEELERMVVHLGETNQQLEHEVQALAMQQMMATQMAPPTYYGH